MRTTLAILLLAAAVGCSNPMNTKLPQDLSKMESIKPSIDKLSPEDKELFGAYIMRHLVASSQGASPIPEGMTIGKCIQEQKAYVQEHGAEDAARKSRTGSPALKKK